MTPSLNTGHLLVKEDVMLRAVTQCLPDLSEAVLDVVATDIGSARSRLGQACQHVAGGAEYIMDEYNVTM